MTTNKTLPPSPNSGSSFMETCDVARTDQRCPTDAARSHSRRVAAGSSGGAGDEDRQPWSPLRWFHADDREP